MEVDLAIVGGGPAGSAAAVTAARAGASVLVVDKASFPRDKCCGDGLTTLALRLGEELGLDPGAIAGWQVVDGAVLHGPSGRNVRVGHAMVEIKVDAKGATLAVDEMGEVRATTVVAADGMWSPTRRLLGLADEGYRGEWHAFRQYVADVGPAAADLHVWFEPDLLPGYAWSFPLSGRRANVGFGVLRGGRVAVGDTGRLWDGLLDRPAIREVLGPSARPVGRRMAWPIPARVGSSALDHGPVLFAGDAAAVTDALTGEGIGQALLTGILAAEASLAGGGQDRVAARYRRRVLGDLRADHRMSVALQRILARRIGADGAVRLAGVSPWTRRNFARWMFEDYPRAIVATPRRWSRGALSTPGAYRDGG